MFLIGIVKNINYIISVSIQSNFLYINNLILRIIVIKAEFRVEDDGVAVHPPLASLGMDGGDGYVTPARDGADYE